MTSTSPLETLGLVVSLLAGTLFQRNYDRYHKLCNIVSTERDILHNFVGTAGMLLHIKES
jgi:hypothetical protein